MQTPIQCLYKMIWNGVSRVLSLCYIEVVPTGEKMPETSNIYNLNK